MVLIHAIAKLYYYYDFKAKKNYYGMLFTMASYLMLILGKFLTFSGAYSDYSGDNGKVLIVSLMLHYFIISLLYSIIFIKHRSLRILFFTIPVLIIVRGLILQERMIFAENMLLLNGIFLIITNEKNLRLSHLLFFSYYVFMAYTGVQTTQPYVFIGSFTAMFGTFFLVKGFSKILYNDKRWES
jgi:hypothetical protein